MLVRITSAEFIHQIENEHIWQSTMYIDIDYDENFMHVAVRNVLKGGCCQEWHACFMCYGLLQK